MKPSSDAVEKIAEDAIGLFLEYRDKHGHTEESAKWAAIREFSDAEHYDASQSETAKPDSSAREGVLTDEAFITQECPWVSGVGRDRFAKKLSLVIASNVRAAISRCAEMVKSHAPYLPSLEQAIRAEAEKLPDGNSQSGSGE